MANRKRWIKVGLDDESVMFEIDRDSYVSICRKAPYYLEVSEIIETIDFWNSSGLMAEDVLKPKEDDPAIDDLCIVVAKKAMKGAAKALDYCSNRSVKLIFEILITQCKMSVSSIVLWTKYYENPELIKCLAQAGVSIASMKMDYRTAEILAETALDININALLLKMGWNPEWYEKIGFRKLIKRGADANLVFRFGFDPDVCTPDELDFLLRHGLTVKEVFEQWSKSAFAGLRLIKFARVLDYHEKNIAWQIIADKYFFRYPEMVLEKYHDLVALGVKIDVKKIAKQVAYSKGYSRRGWKDVLALYRIDLVR